MFSKALGSLRHERPALGSGFAFAAAVVIALVISTGAVRAQDCANEGTVKSTQAGASVALSFRNASNERRRVYWLDQNGERKFYGVVEPQHILKQPTYAGHAWLVTDDAEKCLEIVTATDQPMTVDIGGGAVGQVVPPPPGAEQAISQPQPGATAQPPEPPAAVADQPPQVSPIEQFHLRGAYKLVPRDGPTKALNNESSGSVEITRVKPGWESGKWTFEAVPGTPYVRIKNDWKHTYLADRDGRLRTVKADDDDQDAHWGFEPVDGTDYVQLRNRKSERYLLTQDGDPKLAEHIPEKHENRSYWKVASATRAAAVEDDRVDDAYAAAVADCRDIGGYWTGSSCRARDRVRLTCPRGFEWSPEDDECQWAGRDRCPPWQMHNGRCRADLTCEGGRVRLSGRGQSCQCPSGMVTWGHYPHLTCVPSVVRILPLLLNNRGGHRQGNGPGNNHLGGGKGQGNGHGNGHGNGNGKFNGLAGGKGQGGTTVSTTIDPRTGHKTVTTTVRDPRTGAIKHTVTTVDKNGKVLSSATALSNSSAPNFGNGKGQGKNGKQNNLTTQQKLQQQKAQQQKLEQQKLQQQKAQQQKAQQQKLRATETATAEGAAGEAAATETAAAKGAAGEAAATETATAEGAAAEAQQQKLQQQKAQQQKLEQQKLQQQKAQQQKLEHRSCSSRRRSSRSSNNRSCSSRRRSNKSCSN